MLREKELPEGIARESFIEARNKAIAKMIQIKENAGEKVEYEVEETEEGYSVKGVLSSGEEVLRSISYEEFMTQTSIEKKSGLL